MKLDKKTMKQAIKKVYEKRINYFLNEKIAIKDKRGVNVLEDAIGLKLVDKAGYQYTFGGIVKKDDGTEHAKLYLPEEPREDAYDGGATSPLYEYELEEEEYDGRGFMNRNRDDVRNNIEYDISMPGEASNYDITTVDDIDADSDADSNRKNKIPNRKYILVPMGELEQRFSI